MSNFYVLQLIDSERAEVAVSPGTGAEPRSASALKLEAAGGGDIPPGWYLLVGSLPVSDATPPISMHFRAKDASGELGPVPLLSTGKVARNVIYRVPSAAGMLILAGDPGEAWRAGGVDLKLRRIGRREALLGMLKAFKDRSSYGRWWISLGTLSFSVMHALISGGSASAAARLDARYRALLYGMQSQRGGSGSLRQVMQLRRSPVALPAQEVYVATAGQLQKRDEVWSATGDDPRFVLTAVALGSPLKPGWYRFRARIKVMEGNVVAPCLYPDYGRGGNEGAMIPLGEPDSQGWIDVLLVLEQPTRALRFDPTMRRARFSLDRLRLERLSRFSALFYMLSRIAGFGDRGHLRAGAAALARFTADLRRHSLSNATRELFQRYRDCAVRNQTSYPSWVDRYDSFSELELASLRQRAAALVDGPLISILVPVYQTPEPWLRKCVDSVLAQTYPKWELCIADDASSAPHVRRVLDEYVARDPRIKVVYRESNGHISAASNSALELCTGSYVGLLDHDDELRPHALLEMAEGIVRDPELMVLFSDEDKIDETGRRFDPYFKPDWNPDLMRSQNYLCHFSVIEAGLVREVGGFREGYEGSQDHDLLLRCTERIRPAQIHHVPKVLYHWRAIEGSTALVRDAKDYASTAGARAVRDHLARLGADAEVEELPYGHYRVRWGLGRRPPKVSLIVPTRDRVDLLRQCIHSVLELTRYPDFEIVVVDNQSVEPETRAYFDELSEEPRVRLLHYDAPFNYSAINNWAVSQCDGEIVGLLNNDIEVISPDWLEEMTSHARRPEIGAVGSMLYYPDDRIQHAGVVLGSGGVANHAYVGQPRGYPGHGGRAKVAQGLSAVTAACLLVRRSVYVSVGGLDESLQVAFNDIDFCLRIRAAGYQNLWTPFAELYHHESASRGSDDTPEKAARFRAEVELMESRWGETLYHDPAYNPNLTLFGTDAGLAFPPRSSQITC